VNSVSVVLHASHVTFIRAITVAIEDHMRKQSTEFNAVHPIVSCGDGELSKQGTSGKRKHVALMILHKLEMVG
jgi:hypothetical protein